MEIILLITLLIEAAVFIVMAIVSRAIQDGCNDLEEDRAVQDSRYNDMLEEESRELLALDAEYNRRYEEIYK